MSIYYGPTTISVLGTLWWAQETSSHLHESYVLTPPLGSLRHPPLIRATPWSGIMPWDKNATRCHSSCCIFTVCCVCFPFETWITSRTVAKISFLCAHSTSHKICHWKSTPSCLGHLTYLFLFQLSLLWFDWPQSIILCILPCQKHQYEADSKLIILSSYKHRMLHSYMIGSHV